MEKIEIVKILEWHNSGTLKTDEAIEKIFSLFSVSVSFNNEELKVIKTDVKHIVDRVILNEKDEFIRFQILDKLNER